ncbi:MAG TPA: hypothetical protein VGE39_12440 [Prosthecobacter sp.]
MTPRTKTLPQRVNTAILAPHFQPEDPAVVVKLIGVGSTAPFEMRGGGTAGRSYIMEWNSRLDGHVVRIPLSLWMANEARMAHELMDQRRMSHAMVVTFEMPAATVNVEVSGPGPGPGPAATATATSTGGAASSSASAFDSDLICQPAPKMGAAAYNVDTSIVVGRGHDPQPAAPTLAGAPTNEAVTPGDAALPMIGGRPLHEAAYEKLLKPQRVKALASLLKVREATLREAAGAAGARIEIAGPWVRRRAGR